MSPRAYNMGKRASAVEATRRRIVEATMQLHGEQGIHRTTHGDIAERADVALGTVYRHFPRLEDVVYACGARTMELMQPPAPADVPALFEGARTPAERIERLAREVARLYRDWAIVFRRVREARHAFEPVGEGHREFEALLDALVAEGLRGSRASAEQRKAVRALVDDRFWEVLVERGLDSQAAERELARLIACAASKG